MKGLRCIDPLQPLRHARWGALLLALPVHSAIAEASFAAPTMPAAAVSSGAAGGLLRVTMALLVVLAAVLGTAWLARRVRAFNAAGNVGLEVLSQLSLGARERAVLVRVGERQLLLGVGSGGVRTLYVLDAVAPGPGPGLPPGAGVPATSPVRPNFKELLLRSLGK